MKPNLMKIATLALLAAGMAFGQTTTTPPAGRVAKGQRVRALVQQRMMKALNLTDAQKQQIKAIRQSTRQSLQPVADQLKANRQAMAAAVQAGDTVKIQQLATVIGQEQGQMVAARSEAAVKVQAVLTPEQKAKEAEFRQKVQDLLGKKAAK